MYITIISFYTKFFLWCSYISFKITVQCTGIFYFITLIIYYYVYINFYSPIPMNAPEISICICCYILFSVLMINLKYNDILSKYIKVNKMDTYILFFVSILPRNLWPFNLLNWSINKVNICIYIKLTVNCVNDLNVGCYN